MKLNTFIILGLVSVILLFSCTKETKPTALSVKNLDFTYAQVDTSLKINDDLAKFGRLLFYDLDLSLNGNVSCASCHKQQHSFADNKAKSDGFLAGITDKNTPPLINLGYNHNFFWSNSSEGLSKTCINPIFHPVEMGLSEIVFQEQLATKEIYRDLFDGTQTIEIQKEIVGKALASFVSAMVSTDSKIDRSRFSDKNYSQAELNGKKIYDRFCESCHGLTTWGFTRNNFGIASIGLSFDETWSTLVRIPSLRNIAFTAPYMHDGRFETLQEVIEHYNSGIVNSPELDWRLQGVSMNLSALDKQDLEAFLNTFSDESIIAHEKFSDPYLR